MNKIWEFIKRRPESFSEYCLWIIIVAMAALFWDVLMSFILDTLKIAVNPNTPGIDEKLTKLMNISPWLAIFVFCIFGPFVEELLWRLLPIVGAKMIGDLFPVFSHWIIFVFIILSSLHFGWRHNGPTSLAFQSVSGLFYALLFLKCISGIKYENMGVKSVIIAISVSTCAHGLNNLIAISNVF